LTNPPDHFWPQVTFAALDRSTEREKRKGEILQKEVLTRIRKVDIGLPGKGNSNSDGVRPVYYNHLDDQVDSDQ